MSPRSCRHADLVSGRPGSPEKVLGPAMLLSILGIELDTIKMRARLPPDNLTALMEELNNFSLLHSSSHTCTKRQLLSLIGKPACACKVIPAGRMFLRRLLDTAHSVDGLSDHIHITDETLKDISWWQTFAQSWNGIAFFLDPNWTPAPDLQLFMDASGTLGFGGYRHAEPSDTVASWSWVVLVAIPPKFTQFICLNKYLTAPVKTEKLLCE